MLREIRKRLPAIDVLYFADQAHVPYGDRSPDDLHRLLTENVAHIEALGASALAMGCNTSCAIAERLGWPATGLEILDLIDAAATDVARMGARRIAVLATNATAASGAYGRAIRRYVPDAHVTEAGSSELVPLVEAGTLDGAEAEAAVARALAPFPRDLDAIVLACTHFPFLGPVFARALGDDVRRIDPAVAQAERAQTRFAGAPWAHGTGRTTYLTTGPEAPFAAALPTLVTLRATDHIQSKTKAPAA